MPELRARREGWCEMSFLEQRELLAAALMSALEGADGVEGVEVEAGTPGREYDLTARVQTDVGALRAPLWSHIRATLFCDPSIHPANRARFAPEHAVEDAAVRLRARLTATFSLESRGLTVEIGLAGGGTRRWIAERSRFRHRAAVVREDEVPEAAADEDLRDLLGRFYTGPSLRASGGDGEAFLVPASSEAEGPLVSLCHACGRFQDGPADSCPDCGGPVDVVVAARPSRR